MNQISLVIFPDWKMIYPKDIEYYCVYLEDSFTKISTTDFKSIRTLAEHFIMPSCTFVYDGGTRSLYFTSFTKNYKRDPFDPPFFSRGGISPFEIIRSYVYSISLSDFKSEEILVTPDGSCLRMAFKLIPDEKKVISFLTPNKEDIFDVFHIAYLDISAKTFCTVPFFDFRDMDVEDIHFNPDSILLTNCQGGIVLVDFQGKVIHDLPTLPGPFFGASSHPIEKSVAFSNSAGIGIWEPDSGDVDMILSHGCSPCWSPDGEYLWFYALNSPLQKSSDFTLPSDNSLFYPYDSEGHAGLSSWVRFLRKIFISFIDCSPVLCRFSMKTKITEKILMININDDIHMANAYLHKDGYQYGYDVYDIFFSPCGRYIICPISKWLSNNQRHNYEPLTSFFCFLDLDDHSIWASPLIKGDVKGENTLWVPKKDFSPQSIVF